MRHFLVAALLAAVLSPVALAEEPAAVVADPGGQVAGDLIVLDASASKGDAFDWVLEGSDKRILPIEGGRRCIFTTGTGGTYRFLFLAVGVDGDGKARLVKHRVEVVVSGPPPSPSPSPSPSPNPNPNPGPTPTPRPAVRGRLYVSYILPSDPTPAQAALRTDPALRDGLARLDAAYRSYQDDEEEVRRLNLAGRVREVHAPCLFIQTADGTVLSTIANPSAELVLSAVSTLRGK